MGRCWRCDTCNCPWNNFIRIDINKEDDENGDTKKE